MVCVRARSGSVTIARLYSPARPSYSDMRSIVGAGLAIVAAIGCARRPGAHVTTAREPVEIAPASSETRAMRVEVASSSTEAPPPPTVEAAVAAGRHWRLDTARGPVHVWTPAGYEPATAMTIVYVHGYWVDVDRAWDEHDLPAQFARSGLNAMFIACGAPETYGEPVVWSSLVELLGAVEDGVAQPRAGGPVVAVGHSAAWRTLTRWVREDAREDVIDTLVLFDAAYEVEQFLDWIHRSRDHRLIDVGDDTRPWTERLHGALPDTIVVDGMPAATDGLPTDARVLYIRSEVGHMPLVTGGRALPIVLRALTDERVRGAPAWETRTGRTP
jgi:hypothetical protein